MKTLKFMLAVATAVGLASAAQAAQNIGASTGFEKLKLGDPVRTGVMDNLVGENDKSSYFCYAGEIEDDNESEIVAATGLDGVTRPTGYNKFTGADATSRANALQVSTGADPLLRTFKPIANNKPQPAETFAENTYVDTLVQFTVTPATDTVTPSADDKLMIYLKETSTVTDNDDGTQTTVSSTNLAVTAGYLQANMSSAAKVYTAQNVSVKPGEWYRLTVEAIPAKTVNSSVGEQMGLVLFKIKINDTLCKFDSMPGEQAVIPSLGQTFAQDAFNMQVVLSLQASMSGSDTKNKLQAVGFAGEGLVDDLVITTTDPAATVVNFTLMTGEGVGVVQYTIGANTYWSNSADEIEDVPVGSTIAVVSVDYAEGYEFDSFGLIGLTAVAGSDNSFTVDANASAASLTINAKKAAAASGVVPGAEAVVVGSKEAAEALPIVAVAPEGVDMAGVEYTSYFKKVITENGDGTFSVTAELDKDVVDPDSVAADLVNKFNNITKEGVEVVAKPGLYYSVMQGFDVKNLTEGERTLATGNTVMLKADKYEGEGSGFYKIVVNIKDKQ